MKGGFFMGLLMVVAGIGFLRIGLTPPFSFLNVIEVLAGSVLLIYGIIVAIVFGLFKRSDG